VPEDELFERYIALDRSYKSDVFPNIFGRMEGLQEHGTDTEKKAAELFFEHVEEVVANKEKEIEKNSPKKAGGAIGGE
jgi:hypothetical protein